MSDPKPLCVAHIELGAHLYGGAQQVLYLLRELSKTEVRSVLICPECSAVGEAAQAAGIDVEAIPYRGDLDWRATKRIREILIRHQVDLVHVHSRRGADIWGGLAARKFGLPCVLSRRVDNPERAWAVAAKYRLYDHVIAISEGIRNVLIADGLPPGRVSCVRSAVDWARFQQPADKAGLVSRFDLPEDAMVIGIAAQLIPRKGHDVLLEALSDLVARWPTLQLLVMGKGPSESAIREQIRTRDLGRHVQLVGFVEDLEHVLPSLDFLVHPARTEGLGVVLLQAASAGIAVIACDAGGMPEAVIDQKTGLLVPPDDVDALMAAMESLLSDPERAQAYGAKGRERMLASFSIAAMAQGNANVYRELMATRSDK
jgi:glycosyltransferase involved in cell wall biosynthesis